MRTAERAAAAGKDAFAEHALVRIARVRRRKDGPCAALDLDWTSAEAMGMEQRIDMLEREVGAIKADIAVIKSTYCTREEMRAFDPRLARIEAGIIILKKDVEQLKKDVEQLKNDVAGLRKEIAEIRKEIAEIRSELAQVRAQLQHCATKSDFLELEARTKTWIVGSIFSALTLMTAIQVGLYTAFVR